MKYFTFLLFICFSIGLQAQVQYGTIDYVRTTEMSLPKGDFPDKVAESLHEQMAAAGAFSANFKATFSPDAFSFVEVPKEVVSVQTELAGGGIMIMETGGEEPSSYYTDTKAGKVVNHDFIFDKGFLVEGDAEQLNWTLTDETIPPSEATAGLDLRVATAITAAGDTVTAGYAPSLPIEVGPLNYYGLPGAIITLRIPGANGASVYRATSLSVSSEPLKIAKPAEGKKISLTKFRSEKAKKQKMMKRRFNID
ncbi:GLPGLI family protein [Neolewinella aurantiaca]|uniref:GLPGLI family protein n=1 Tax=Neolewinella aurantiaca TaxID=2602767 RepID=A0A5C7FMA2_9BACT|nr:GLPGLI family protein [Neolewinella aurantiaca]TXF88566.1 GLPGLI family protein [Neolewinella aurantiaca]